jgi:hypothetical protein
MRIMMATIELKRLNKQLMGIIHAHDQTTTGEVDRQLLKLLVTKKQEETSKLKAVVQQCTFDKQPHRMWLTTCYMFLPLFVDVENRMFNIMLTATHMHNSISELQYEMVAHILQETNGSLEKHIQSCKSALREQLEPFAHNRSMIQRYIHGTEKGCVVGASGYVDNGGDVGEHSEGEYAMERAGLTSHQLTLWHGRNGTEDEALDFRQHITEDLALIVFTDINRLLEEKAVKQVISNARRPIGVTGAKDADNVVKCESADLQCS